MPGGKNSNTTLLLDAAQKVETVETKETKIESNGFNPHAAAGSNSTTGARDNLFRSKQWK